FVSVELLCKRLARCLELFQIGVSPPIAQMAFGVKLGARVVKAMTDLMANRGAYAPIVYRGRRSGIVERRLENARREVQRVQDRQADRVHVLRFHRPLL